MKRSPSAASCHSEPAARRRRDGAGRRFSPADSHSAETANVAASMSSAAEGSRTATSAPAGQEADHLRELQRDVGQRRRDGVALALEHVGHERRAGRLERWRAQRDQEEQAQQHRQRHPGDRHARPAARARAMSVAMSTRWRGSRSARADSSGPPSSHGRWPMAKVSADSSGELVRW